MIFVALGIALTGAGLNLALSLAKLAEKPSLAIATFGFDCVVIGLTFLWMGWSTREWN